MSEKSRRQKTAVEVKIRHSASKQKLTSRSVVRTSVKGKSLKRSETKTPERKMTPSRRADSLSKRMTMEQKPRKTLETTPSKIQSIVKTPKAPNKKRNVSSVSRNAGLHKMPKLSPRKTRNLSKLFKLEKDSSLKPQK